jgi:hypothetical protein
MPDSCILAYQKSQNGYIFESLSMFSVNFYSIFQMNSWISYLITHVILRNMMTSSFNKKLPSILHTITSKVAGCTDSGRIFLDAFNSFWIRFYPKQFFFLSFVYVAKIWMAASSHRLSNSVNKMSSVGERNWIQTRRSLKIERLYFLSTLRSSSSAEYNAWWNYLDR